jgi:hypothetical protein
MIYGAPTDFTIDNTNGDLLTDPIWVNLTGGGMGHSKTWRLDFDSDEASIAFSGPFYFMGLYDSWETVTNGYDYKDETKSWLWPADWGSVSSWMGLDPTEFGTLTFDLIDGAHIAVNGKAAGAYTVDTDNHKMNLPETAKWYGGNAADWAQDWYDIKLLSLTEYTMQISIVRASDPCTITFNYVADGWDGVYPDDGSVSNAAVVDPYDGSDNDALTTTTTTEKKWKLVEDAPYDWYWWNGATAAWESNGFSDAKNYSKTWCPALDEDQISDFSLTLTKKDETSGTFVASTVAGEEAGTYTISGSTLKFSTAVTWIQAGSVIDMTTDELTIVKFDQDANELWLGTPTKYSTTGKVSEYLCIKVAEVKSTGTTEVQNGTRLVVDNSKILYGNLEGNGNLRIEIFNAYGSGTKDDSPIDITKVKYKESIKVTFTVSGIGTLNEPVTAFLMNSLGGVWSSGADNGIDTTITGDGTYTVGTTGAGSGADAGSFVFNVDMQGAANQTETDLTPGDASRCPNISVKIDSIWLDHTDE